MRPPVDAGVWRGLRISCIPSLIIWAGLIYGAIWLLSD
ncbi:hypothetical protein vBEliSR6L_24 [Erythrobacter phage vB_EliS_R6L]|nr:hypothetical protein vBEliSR6L_24 [Erythrobacter phage vB_EliS_R6L]